MEHSERCDLFASQDHLRILTVGPLKTELLVSQWPSPWLQGPSFMAGDPNAQWADDKLYWPRYNESETGSGIELVFNTTMYTQDDDLAIEKVVYWNKALWY